MKIPSLSFINLYIKLNCRSILSYQIIIFFFKLLKFEHYSQAMNIIFIIFANFKEI
jgi:hypothetical protein